MDSTCTRLKRFIFEIGFFFKRELNTAPTKRNYSLWNRYVSREHSNIMRHYGGLLVHDNVRLCYCISHFVSVVGPLSLMSVRGTVYAAHCLQT